MSHLEENHSPIILNNGFHFVRLLTVDDIDREASIMRHNLSGVICAQRLDDGRYSYLSLRDEDGNPCATLELKGNKLISFQGEDNAPPLLKYAEAIKSYAVENGIKINIPVAYIGYLINDNGSVFNLDDLPAGLRISGNIDFRKTSIGAIPTDFYVDGNLFLGGSRFSYLSGGLHVTGDLYLSGSNVSSLPKFLRVDGKLDLDAARVTSLAEHMAIGDLSIRHQKEFLLPENLKVTRTLDMRDSGIEFIPEGVSVGKTIIIKGTNITSLPASMNDDVMVMSDDGDFTVKDFRMRAPNKDANYSDSVFGRIASKLSGTGPSPRNM